MKKYTLKARAGIEEVQSQELDWTRKDFDKFQHGDHYLMTEARGIAHELTNLEYWIEETEE